MDVSIIIVSYNTFTMTREAVASALAACGDLASEVIVVDNNSPDGSARRLPAAFPPEGPLPVKVIENASNQGFSAANNQGAACATGQVLLFLNPDTVSHGNAVESLYRFVCHTADAGAVGPLVLNADGSIQASTASFPSFIRLMRYYFALRNGSPHAREESREVDVVKGCALAVTRKRFDEAGGWDPSYFMYAEERELCLAMKNTGYKNYLCADAVITHYGGASTKDAPVAYHLMHQRSALAYLKRHHSGALVAANRMMGIAGFFLRDLFFGLKQRFSGDDSSIARRREAAAALWRWFLFDYGTSEKE